ncbi:FabD/lysophospholipase-like protein [Trichodelitschia bisporula]|uniref:[acyl-carrier-protein] S-malonyltransferase n=1 Tax=Trichodelitschia bisporula TaxID=703511 RepID=A0A6G1HTC8_9PEZI|nr:FabD/lysophospholipase-like protein [Trichodelitschia bisporula]
MLTSTRHELSAVAVRGSAVLRPRLRHSTLRWSSTSTGASTRPRTAIFFPGQGVQRVGMTTPWLTAFPRTVQPILDEIDETLGIRLSRIIESGTNAELNATENSQPAIMATSVLILRVLEQEFGFKTAERVDFTLGHSLGEFAALVAGGYLQFSDALLMVRKRGEIMAQCTKEAWEKYGGEMGMVALVCENENRMQDLLVAIDQFIGLSSCGSKYDSSVDVPPVQQVVVANINSKNQIVLSGSIERINTLLTHVRQFGGHDPRHVRLHADSPFHSPLMKPAVEFMRKTLDFPSPRTRKDKVTFPGLMPCVSNTSGTPFTSRENLKDQLARQAAETVHWWESVRYLDKEEKVRRWIGIGPGKVGRNLVGKEVGMKGATRGGGVWGLTSPHEIADLIRELDETENPSTFHPSSPPSSSSPSPSSTNSHSSALPHVSRLAGQAASRVAAYISNPAIVQRLWPPPQRLPGILPGGEAGARLAYGLSHSEAMFKPESGMISSS